MVHTLRLDNYTPIPRKLVLGTNSSFGTESIKIERGAGWDGLNLTATWHIPGREEPLRVALLDGDTMDVPPEVTKEAKDGVLVLAGLASGVQRASCNVEYLILEQAGVYGGADAEPTPELAAQVLEAALQAKADAEAAAEDAAAAKANADKAQSDAEKAQQAAENAAADAAKAGPYAEAARAAQEAAELARNGAIAAQQAAENAAAAAAASKSAADTLATEAARAAQAAENSKAAANNAADLAGENATAAQQAAATATAAANDAGQIASDAAASKAAAETAAKAAQDAQTAAAAAEAEAVKAQVAAQTAAKSAQDARDAAANSAAAAKTSEDAAAKSAEDADNTANSIKDSMTQIAANKEAVSQLKEDLDNIISPNLFNPAEVKENTAINQDDGTEMSFDGWLATGYIPVTKGNVLYFSSNSEPTPYSTGAFYDSQKKFVSGFGNPNNNNNITVTSDGYARFSFGNTPEKIQIEKGSRTTYVPYGELKVKADVDNVKEETDNIKAEVSEVRAEVAKIQEDHSNLFNKDAVVKGAVLPDSGYFDTSFSSWDSSDYIPVKPGMVLYFSSNELPIGVASTGAYFDKDKKYLSGIRNEPTVLTVLDGAYYLRFSKNGGLGDTLNTLKIEQYGITKFTPYGELYVTVTESALPSSIIPKWKGLKILTLGDSIAAMGGVNGWTHWIKQYLLADKVVNVSVAGSTWQDKVANQTYDGNPQPSTDGNVMGNQVQKVLNAKSNGDADYQDFDVITFSFGTNDSVDFSVQTKESVENQFITNYAQNNFTVVPIDNVNRQTLAGAMRYGFQKLHEAYPNAVIFMCTPTQECYETFDSIYKKGDFINFVADRLGAETIDTRRCGIRNIYESQTTIDYDHPEQSGVAPIQTDLLDGIHTNENGAKKIAKYNAREIMKYFMIN